MTGTDDNSSMINAYFSAISQMSTGESAEEMIKYIFKIGKLHNDKKFLRQYGDEKDVAEKYNGKKIDSSIMTYLDFVLNINTVIFEFDTIKETYNMINVHNISSTLKALGKKRFVIIIKLVAHNEIDEQYAFLPVINVVFGKSKDEIEKYTVFNNESNICKSIIDIVTDIERKGKEVELGKHPNILQLENILRDTKKYAIVAQIVQSKDIAFVNNVVIENVEEKYRFMFPIMKSISISEAYKKIIYDGKQVLATYEMIIAFITELPVFGEIKNYIGDGDSETGELVIGLELSTGFIVKIIPTKVDGHKPTLYLHNMVEQIGDEIEEYGEEINDLKFYNDLAVGAKAIIVKDEIFKLFQIMFNTIMLEVNEKEIKEAKEQLESVIPSTQALKETCDILEKITYSDDEKFLIDTYKIDRNVNIINLLHESLEKSSRIKFINKKYEENEDRLMLTQSLFDLFIAMLSDQLVYNRYMRNRLLNLKIDRIIDNDKISKYSNVVYFIGEESTEKKVEGIFTK